MKLIIALITTLATVTTFATEPIKVIDSEQAVQQRENVRDAAMAKIAGIPVEKVTASSKPAVVVPKK